MKGKIWVTFDDGGEDPPDPDKVPEFLPEGKYEVLVEAVDVKWARISGHSYLHWTLAPTGWRCYHYIHPEFRFHYITPLKPGTTWILADFLEAVGGRRPWGTMKIKPEDFVGKTVIVNVQVDTYQCAGAQVFRNRIVSVEPQRSE